DELVEVVAEHEVARQRVWGAKLRPRSDVAERPVLPRIAGAGVVVGTWLVAGGCTSDRHALLVGGGGLHGRHARSPVEDEAQRGSLEKGDRGGGLDLVPRVDAGLVAV